RRWRAAGTRCGPRVCWPTVTTIHPAATPSADDSASAGVADARIAIVGLGYVGLSLAMSFVDAGLDVVGIDAYRPRVQELVEGHSPIDDVDDGRLQEALGTHLRVVHSTEAALAESDVI